MRETEVKIKVTDGVSVYSRITGFAEGIVPLVLFEDDTLYDFPDIRLFKAGSIFRLRRSSAAVRDEAGKYTAKPDPEKYKLTWKGPSDTSRGYKEVEELEFDVSEPAAMSGMLRSFGLTPLFRYQKYRSVFELRGVKIIYDETPMGLFLEIEGEADKIDETAGGLGFARPDFISLDYYSLWRAYCRENNMPEGDMLFNDR